MAYNHVGGDTAHGLFFAILGSILFIPGFYYTRIAYYAYKGYKGMKNQSSCFEIFLLFSLPDCDSPICFIRNSSTIGQVQHHVFELNTQKPAYYYCYCILTRRACA
ncbi:hypothetical protein P8452_77739 [Trifolium repens]|nr:hypothetical protein P8452_77739 [Trifolium repens]